MVLIQSHKDPLLHPAAAHSLAGNWHHLVAHGGSNLEAAEHLQVAGALPPPALWDWEAGLDVEHSSGSHRSGREEWGAPRGCADAASGCPGCRPPTQLAGWAWPLTPGLPWTPGWLLNFTLST